MLTQVHQDALPFRNAGPLLFVGVHSSTVILLSPFTPGSRSLDVRSVALYGVLPNGRPVCFTLVQLC